MVVRGATSLEVVQEEVQEEVPEEVPEDAAIAQVKSRPAAAGSRPLPLQLAALPPQHWGIARPTSLLYR